MLTLVGEIQCYINDCYYYHYYLADWFSKSPICLSQPLYQKHGCWLFTGCCVLPILTFQLLPKTAGEFVICPKRVRRSSCGKPLKLPHRPHSWRLKPPGTITSAWLSPFHDTCTKCTVQWSPLVPLLLPVTFVKCMVEWVPPCTIISDCLCSEKVVSGVQVRSTQCNGVLAEPTS